MKNEYSDMKMEECHDSPQHCDIDDGLHCHHYHTDVLSIILSYLLQIQNGNTSMV